MVPLRVPMVALTETFYNFEACLKGCGLHAIDCGVIYLYPRRENFKLCKHLSLLALGWAVLTIVPIPTGLHRPRKERGCYTYCSRLSCVSLLVQYVNDRLLVGGGESNPDAGGGRDKRSHLHCHP